MNTRLTVALSIIGALLAAVFIALIVVISQLQASAAQDRHERRVEICERDSADPYGADLDETLACIQRLERNAGEG